jgi:hypothetical protein
MYCGSRKAIRVGNKTKTKYYEKSEKINKETIENDCGR